MCFVNNVFCKRYCQSVVIISHVASCHFMMMVVLSVCAAATLWPECVQREYLNDNWVWDYHTKPPEVLLSPDLEDAYFHTDPVDQSTGTAGKHNNSSP